MTAVEAFSLYQHHLDVLRDAVWHGNVTSIRAELADAMNVEMLDGERYDLDADPVIVRRSDPRAAMFGQGATSCHRVAAAAPFDDGRRIRGRYRSHVQRGGEDVIEPCHCDVELHADGADWRMTATPVVGYDRGAATFQPNSPRASSARSGLSDSRKLQ